VGIDARSGRRNSTSARSGERIGIVCSSSWWQGPVGGEVHSRGPEKDEVRTTQTEDGAGAENAEDGSRGGESGGGGNES
jgi:hypothetical protein